MEEAIIIRSRNPADITPEETEEFAQQVRAFVADVEVQVIAEQRTGVGVTWAELLSISLPWALLYGKKLSEKVADKILDIAVEWARKRFEERKLNSKRPVYVDIYGPDGEIVKSIAVKNANDVEDRTEQQRQLFGKQKRK